MSNYNHSWGSLTSLVETDPEKLRDLAYTFLNDSRDAQRLLYKLVTQLQNQKDNTGIAIKEIQGFVNSITAP